MQALDDMIAVLGKPVFARALLPGKQCAATIARWRHGTAVVDVASSTTIRIAMSLLTRPNARLRGCATGPNQTSGGLVSIFAPTDGATVEVSGEADIVQLFLDDTLAEALLDTSFVCPPMHYLRDERMPALVMGIVVASDRRGPDDALLVEQHLHTLALRIEHHAIQGQDSLSTRSRLYRGGLAPAAFRRVEAMVATALDESGSPTLADMADAACLSIMHFIRGFRRHTGTTPHKYLVRRRLERAISLLRVARFPIAEVADAVGFATPAHFVATFRTTLGVTPAAVRDALSH